MSTAQLSRIETRAQRIAAKANSLGFTKNGSPMVIDQAREIVAAEDGHRNWHALRASLPAAATQKNGQTIVQYDLCSSMLAALEVAAAALDRMADGADFDRVVDESGVTYTVLTAIRDAKAAGKAPGPTYESLHQTLFAIGAQNDVWTRRDAMDTFVNGLLQSARETLGMEIDGAGDLVAATPKAAAAADPTYLTRKEREEAQAQGWDLFTAHGDVVELQIQSDDEMATFDGDDAAWLFVIEEATRNPKSAAASAIKAVRDHSPDEYRRIELFDRKNGKLLPQRPSSSAGHLVDPAEVAEWVGLHHKVLFDNAGTRQQEWIDRFVAAHADDERFATFLVAESWTHIFVCKTESLTRWVYRLGSENEGVVFAQIRGELGHWTQLERAAMKDLEESINDNDIPDTYRTAWSSEVEAMPQLPCWAER